MLQLSQKRECSIILYSIALFTVFDQMSAVFLTTPPKNVFNVSLETLDEIPSELIPFLYRTYKDAVDRDEKSILRRQFIDKGEYEIHVQKLKEVNGYKRHNLRVKDVNNENPIIYINNPVESKLPNAYLTLEEFKKSLENRVIKQRNTLRLTTVRKHRPQKKTKHRLTITTIAKSDGKNKGVISVKNTEITKKIFINTRSITKTTPTNESIKENNAVVVEQTETIQALETVSNKTIPIVIKTTPPVIEVDIITENDKPVSTNTTEDEITTKAGVEITTNEHNEVSLLSLVAKSTKKSTTKLKKKTLGRPLVFMGGY